MVTEAGGAVKAATARAKDLRNRRWFVGSFSNPEVGTATASRVTLQQ
jgi:hypothetical protein